MIEAEELGGPFRRSVQVTAVALPRNSAYAGRP